MRYSLCLVSRRHQIGVSWAFGVAAYLAVVSATELSPLVADEQTSPVVDNKQIDADLEKSLKDLKADSASIAYHSRRGDLLFFLRRYKEAVASYRAMVKLDPAVDTSHWRLGIALFFAKEPAKAAAQFEKYHSFDDVDRENGIWRYLSQYKATDKQTAKKELIRYAKDDREPFPAVYKLFDDSMTPAEALAAIPDDISATERDKRLFYTELYIGMHMVVKKREAEARKYLRLAVSRKWPQGNGFGPDYMWHVGRVQLADLSEAADAAESR